MPWPWKRKVIGCAVLVVAMNLQPDGPWWRELGAMLLFMMGTRIYDTGSI